MIDHERTNSQATAQQRSYDKCMILFKFKTLRNNIEASVNWDGIKLSAFHQHQHVRNGTWSTSHTDCISIAITPHWSWGDEHMFSFGFLRIHYVRLGWQHR